MKRPTDKQIEDKRDDAADAAMKAAKYPGMSYAEGIRDALEWVMGDFDGDLDC